MAAEISSRVFDAPLHVSVGKGGCVRVFLPDGSSVALSNEAAARSLQELFRAVSRTRPRAKVARPGGGNIIVVDFPVR